jgi:hypothetical protein
MEERVIVDSSFSAVINPPLEKIDIPVLPGSEFTCHVRTRAPARPMISGSSLRGRAFPSMCSALNVNL